MGEKMNTMVKQKVRQLKISDRCDRLPSPGVGNSQGRNWRAIFLSSPLLQKHEDVLYNWAYEIIDEREFINEKPQSSA